MTLPKALLCFLDEETPKPESEDEMTLRQTGFATATINWHDLKGQPTAWAGLADVLGSSGICAWILSGRLQNFTSEIISQAAILSLGLEPDARPKLAMVVHSPAISDARQLADSLPPILSQAKIYSQSEHFAVKLMAGRLKKTDEPVLPFRLRTRLSPLFGVWLEIGPLEGEVWPGFFIAAVGARVDAVGVGLRGEIPDKCVLEYPLLNMEGTIGDQKWHGASAGNSLNAEHSIFARLSQAPSQLLVKPGSTGIEAGDDDDAFVLSFCKTPGQV